MKLSKRKQAVIFAINKGYKFVNGNIVSPKGKIIKGYSSWDGYLCFTIGFPDYKTKRAISVHQFVAYKKFGNKAFEENIVVRHLDGNKKNNNDKNIDIGSQSDNMMDKSKEIRLELAVKNSSKNRKFTDEQVILIKLDRSNGMTYKQLSIKYNTCKSQLSYMFNNNYVTKA
jgi:hypothetical protein